MNALLDPPAPKKTGSAVPRIEELILIRMALPAKKPPSPKTIRDDVGALLGQVLPEQEYLNLTDKLLAQDFLAKGRGKARLVTETGKKRALALLGLTGFPAKSNWQSVIAAYWFPLATGLDASQAVKIKSKDQCAAFLLKQHYQLNDQAGTSIKQVAETLVCRQLGFPQLSTFQQLAQHVLGTMLGNQALKLKQIHDQLPCFQTGLKTTSAKAIRELLVREWLLGRNKAVPVMDRAESNPQQQEAFDLPAFAATVRRLGRDSKPAARFHHDKVFVAALWQSLQHEPQLPQLTLNEFKQHLIEANTAGLLQLRRADLVQVMDPQLVKDSETQYLNATFHFVLID